MCPPVLNKIFILFNHYCLSNTLSVCLPNPGANISAHRKTLLNGFSFPGSSLSIKQIER
ncbi:hypothetical protein OBV_21780 [Oscillibacter valericigenes Sjm18-20]|nr:hypothetical protein OBV_21780 [Oscillibacter valericigenes Sjm18-20]